MKHLSNDDLLAVVEDQTSHVEHLDACDACRVRVQELRGILLQAREVEVPEPSPLFWDHFSERVRTSVAEEPQKERWTAAGAPSRGWGPARLMNERWTAAGAPWRGWGPARLMKVPSWSRWGLAWPAGVLAALAVAITSDQWRSPNGSAGPESTVADVRGAGAPGSNNDAPGSELTSPLSPRTDDPSWAFMTDLAGDLDWEGAGAAGLVARPGSAERALDNLSAAEREAAIEILRQELGDRATSTI